MSFSADEVSGWDVESVCGWLHLKGYDSLIPSFRDNDVSGIVLLDLDDELLGELKVPGDKRAVLLQCVKDMKTAKSSSAGAAEAGHLSSDSDSDDGTPEPNPSPTGSKGSSPTKRLGRRSSSQLKVDKKKDPLRLAAKHKAVADLDKCTVTSGFLWKVGGSGLKMKHWKRRFAVLTDDNCLYYFKSPKDVSALGMVLLPSYTITVADKSDNPGNRPHAFKAFNRQNDQARKYIFAADTMEEMKTWMNVMSLASIAFGSGKASMSKESKEAPQLASDADVDLQLMQKRASERAGGVTGDEQTPAAAAASTSKAKMPSYLKKTHRDRKGPKLCLIKLLDGQTLQLWAEPKTTGQDLLDQICLMLSAYEKYYFGLSFIDAKGEEDWVKLDKRIIKHDIPKTNGDHIELEFRIRFYPMDVTQVLQYVTLYQVFLASKSAVLKGELEISNKDALLLASLALQAQRGDFDSSKHSAEALAREELIPLKNMSELQPPPGVEVASLSMFLAEEVVRVWKTLQGILKHLAVLKYMQIMQKHPLFAMQFFDIKNKKGTPLNMGVNPHGLFVYRFGENRRPIVTFSWAETAELSFTEKKFQIQVHDKETRAFTVYCNRAKTCQRILYLCIGLHRLYVQSIRNWQNAPADLAEMRRQAIQAALKEREALKAEAAAVRAKAKELRAKKEQQQAAAAAAAGGSGAGKASGPAGAAAPASAPSPERAPLVAPQAPLVQQPAVPDKPAEPEIDDEEADDWSAEEDEEEPAAASLIQADAGETVIVKGRSEAVKMLDMMMDDEDFMKYQEMLMSDLDSDMQEMLEGEDFRLRSWTMDSNIDVPSGAEGNICSSDVLGDRVEYLAELDNAQ